MMVTLSALILAACGTDDPDDIIDDGEITVHFDTLGGPSVESQTVSLGDGDVTIPQPERDGYVFAGWYWSENLDTAFDANDFTVDEDITLYARWLEIFDVHFRDADGTLIETVQVVEGDTVDAISAPEKTQAEFAAWVTDYTSLTPFDFDAPITENTDIYGHWLSIHMVEFVVDGTVVETVDVLHGAVVTLPDNPEKEGHTFMYWSLSDGIDDPFDESESIQASMTLYAYFEANEYTITFETYDADDMPDMVAPYDSVISAPDMPELDGYFFEGWYLDEDFIEAFIFETMPLGDITLYARFLPVGSINTITFYVNGNVFDEQTVYDDEFVVMPEDPEKAGHTFVGWETLDGMFDESEPIHQHLTIHAVFEPNNYTIHFEDDLADALMAPYGSPIEAPEDPELEGYVFIGWYLDADHTEPFVFDTMPLGGANLYARFVDENDALSIADVIVMQPDTAVFDNLTLIYSEYMEDEGLHIALLSDGEHAIIMMVDPEALLNHSFSFEAHLIYEGDYPIIVAWESVEDHGLNEDFTLDYTPVTLDDLADFEFTPWTVGTPLEVTGLMMLEENEAIFFDGANQHFYALMNVVMNDTYDAEFEALDHGYVTLQALTFLTFDENSTALFYINDEMTVMANPLDESDKVNLLAMFMQAFFDSQTFYPDSRLEIPPAEPFFGFVISAEAIANADFYDEDSDRFLWVEEDTVVTFEITLENGTTEAFEIDIVLKAVETVNVIDTATQEQGLIDVVVLDVTDRYLFVQDDTGTMTIEHYGTLDVAVGDRVILHVQLAPTGPMTRGFSPSLERTLSAAEGKMPTRVIGMVDLPVLKDTQHGVFETTLEGVLLPGDGQYPFMLYEDGIMLYLDMNHDSALFANLGDMLYTRVDMDLIVAAYRIMEPEGYVAFFDGNVDEVTSTPLSESEVFALVQGWIGAIEMPLRPGETLELPDEWEPLEMIIHYETESDLVDLEADDRGVFVTMLDEGTALIDVTLALGEVTHDFTLALLIEDYDLSSIAYAKALPEGTTVTLRVDVVATTPYAHHYVLTDESGIVVLNANTISEWFQQGDTLIITGNLMEEDGIMWLADAVFETYAEGEPAGLPPLNVVDEAEYFTKEDFTDGIEYVELEGLLDYANGNLSLIWLDDNDEWLTLGIDPGYSYIWTFIGETVILRGFVLTDTEFNLNVLAYTSRVVTEYDGTIDGLYDEEDGTRVWMDAYLVAYENGIFYAADSTGIIEIHGINETFALNRIGDRATLYLTLRQASGSTYLESHNWYAFNDRESVDPEGFLPPMVEATVNDVFTEIDTTLNTVSKSVYLIEGTLLDVNGEMYLEDEGERIRVHDLSEWMPDWEAYLDTTVELSLIMTRVQTAEGNPIMVLVPFASED